MRCASPPTSTPPALPPQNWVPLCRRGLATPHPPLSGARVPPTPYTLFHSNSPMIHRTAP